MTRKELLSEAGVAIYRPAPGCKLVLNVGSDGVPAVSLTQEQVRLVIEELFKHLVSAPAE